MSRTIRIGIAQLTPKVGSVSYNVEKAIGVIDALASQRADYVLLPEFYFTGYNPSKIGGQMIRESLEFFHEIDQSLSLCARKNQIVILAGMGFLENNQKVSNSVCIYDQNGQLAGVYRKNFSFSNEKSIFHMGSDLPVFSIGKAKFGVLICYDVGFPETARQLALKGAEIIFISAAWRKEDELSWELNIQSRALENQLFTVGVNQVAEIEGLSLFGRSMLCSPNGRKQIQLAYGSEMSAVVEVDLDEIATVRRETPYLLDFKNSPLFNKR